MSFESVKQNGPVWEPKQTGSKKTKDLTALEATNKSFIDGYYLGCQTGQGPDNNSTIHKIKCTKVGDSAHIIGEKDESKEVSIWGTNVLNDNLSKINVGDMVRIVWEGKKEPKKGGNEYHSWDVLVDRSVEPLSGASNPVATTAQDEAAPVASPVVAEVEDDDDLPF